MVDEWIAISRLVELYQHGWLKQLPHDFLYVYLNIADQVYCFNSEVSTYKKQHDDFQLHSFHGEPAVVWRNGTAEWWDEIGVLSRGRIQ